MAKRTKRMQAKINVHAREATAKRAAERNLPYGGRCVFYMGRPDTSSVYEGSGEPPRGPTGHTLPIVPTPWILFVRRTLIKSGYWREDAEAWDDDKRYRRSHYILEYAENADEVTTVRPGTADKSTVELQEFFTSDIFNSRSWSHLEPNAAVPDQEYWEHQISSPEV